MLPTLKVMCGDVFEKLAELPSNSVHVVCTSPPYWGLRDYGVDGQIGLEKTPKEYIEKMVAVFENVKRVLHPSGTVWLNIGDSYAGYWGDKYAHKPFGEDRTPDESTPPNKASFDFNGSIKPKDLCLIPERVILALQDAGWWVRSKIAWCKRAPMPESVIDRPTSAWEPIFLLTKQSRYFYDAEAVKVEASESYANDSRWDNGSTDVNYKNGYAEAMAQNPKMPHRVFNGERRTKSNLRNFWLLSPEPFSDSHFATFPTEIPKRAILAGTSAKGCCPKCGEPWVRVVEVNGRMGKSWHDHSNDEVTGQSKAKLESVITTKTIGWQPDCECYATLTGYFHTDTGLMSYGPMWQPQPCTVLDIFAGSGTTGQVAIELGRNAILIELNPKYVQLIEKRCNVTPGLQLA